MITEAERFSTEQTGICPHLRWKEMFIQVPRDRSVPRGNSGHFWCIYTQNCIGPDGIVAEPGNCRQASRACYGTGRCE